MELRHVLAGKKTLEHLASNGVRFAEGNKNKTPRRKGWKDENIDIEKAPEIYESGHLLLALFADTSLCVVDVDDLENPRAKEIMEIAERCDVWRCASRKGMHLYFEQDADSDVLFDGRMRFGFTLGKRKDAKPIGDMLRDHAVAYKRAAGKVIGKISACPGLFELLSLGDEPPSRKAIRIYDDVSSRLADAKAGERNAVMFRCFLELRRRLVSAGLDEEGIRKRMLDLCDEYTRLNPSDAGAFNEARVDELLATPCKTGEGKSIQDDIVRATLDAYTELHDASVLIEGGGRDEDREVFEWDGINKEWKRRYMCQQTEAGVESMMTSLCDLYRSFHKDKHNEEPSVAKEAAAEALMAQAMKRKYLRASPASVFDRPQGSACKAIIDGDKVMLADGREGVVSFDEVNEAGDYLLARMGETAEAECKRWTSFLNEVFDDDEETVAFIGRLLASAFIPTTPPMFVICHGIGANGKSVFLSSIAKMLGEHAIECSPHAFMEPSQSNDQKRQLDERSRMLGRKIVVCPETGSDNLDLPFVKAMTGGEAVQVGGMFKKSRSVRIHALPIVATNELPRLRDVSHAVKRRIVVIPFGEIFGEDGTRPADPYLQLKLSEEMPAMRSWLLKQVEEFVKQGCEVATPEKLIARADEYLEDQTHPIESMLLAWLDKLPAGTGDMVIGRKIGKGNEARYTGALSLAMWAYNSANLQTKKPTQKQVKNWLRKRGIISDARGRYNCKPSEELSRLLLEEKDAPAEGGLFSSRTRSASDTAKVVDENNDEPDEDFAWGR